MAPSLSLISVLIHSLFLPPFAKQTNKQNGFKYNKQINNKKNKKNISFLIHWFFCHLHCLHFLQRQQKNSQINKLISVLIHSLFLLSYSLFVHCLQNKQRWSNTTLTELGGTVAWVPPTNSVLIFSAIFLSLFVHCFQIQQSSNTTIKQTNKRITIFSVISLSLFVLEQFCILLFVFFLLLQSFLLHSFEWIKHWNYCFVFLFLLLDCCIFSEILLEDKIESKSCEITSKS